MVLFPKEKTIFVELVKDMDLFGNCVEKDIDMLIIIQITTTY